MERGAESNSPQPYRESPLEEPVSRYVTSTSTPPRQAVLSSLAGDVSGGPRPSCKEAAGSRESAALARGAPAGSAPPPTAAKLMPSLVPREASLECHHATPASNATLTCSSSDTPACSATPTAPAKMSPPPLEVSAWGSETISNSSRGPLERFRLQSLFEPTQRLSTSVSLPRASGRPLAASSPPSLSLAAGGETDTAQPSEAELQQTSGIDDLHMDLRTWFGCTSTQTTHSGAGSVAGSGSGAVPHTGGVGLDSLEEGRCDSSCQDRTVSFNAVL